MNWRSTLILLAVVVVVLVFVLGRESGEDGAAQRRLAEGYFYPHAVETIRTIELAYPERVLRLEKRELDGRERWLLTAPVEDLGDSVIIERMLATLRVQEVTRWLPPVRGAALAEYGLDAPRLELRLETPSGWDTLRFGDVNPVEKRLYAQGSWRDSLALVGALLRTHSLKGRYELTDKRPMGDLPLSAVESLSIANDRGRFTLIRGAEGWEIRRPEPYRADDRSVSRMLDRLWGESIIDFIDDDRPEGEEAAFEAPRAEMTVKVRGRLRPQRLEVGRPWFELHRVRNSERGHAFLLDSTTVTPLTESFSAFLSTVLVSFLPGKVQSVTGPDGLTLRRAEGERWSWVDERGDAVAGAAVAVLLNRILRLATERVEALLPRQDQLRDWGLEPPARSFDLVLEGGRRLRIELGAPRGGRIAFRRADYPTVYSLPAERVELDWPPSATGE